jgi:gamma-D-glutamyl-L-lysine dipeptidyl-peptidase
MRFACGRFRRVIIVCALSIAGGGCKPAAEQPMIDALLADARKQLAPDRRTAMFEVTGTLVDTTLTLRGELHNSAMKADLYAFITRRKHFGIVDSIVVLPTADVADRPAGVVSVGVANIRTAPSHTAELATQAILGTPVSVLKREGDWLYVQTPDRYLGWTDDAVVRFSGDEMSGWLSRPKVIVVAPLAWIRASRSRGAPAVADAVAGSLLALTAEDRESYAVTFPDGRTGVLAKADARPYSRWLASLRYSGDDVIATAQSLLGVPYLWGGTSTKGMDCSGFTKTVYFLNGILLPRDANQQAHVGMPIATTAEMDEVRPGDLLFFGTHASADRPERVTHVAVSLGGKRFVECSGYVRISSLSPADGDFSDARLTGFLGATRVIDADQTTGIYRLSTLIPLYAVHDH